jgi:hypothetical protein
MGFRTGKETVQTSAAIAAEPRSSACSMSPWRDVYRVGAISAIVYIALVVAAMVLDVLMPPPVERARAWAP